MTRAKHLRDELKPSTSKLTTLLCWGMHTAFRRGNIVVIQDEAGTTQGCPKCGFKNLDFEGDRDLKSDLEVFS